MEPTMTDRPQLVELADGVFARMCGDDRMHGFTNAGVIVGDDSVCVIEGLAVPRHARDLIDDVRRVTSKPVRYVIDTHSHWDHAFGNEAFEEATVVAHRLARRELEEFGEEQRRRVVARGDGFETEVGGVRIRLPDLTFNEQLSLHFGGRAIDLHYLGRAHTAGDVFVHLPDERVLFTGDVAQVRRFPFVADGYLRDWVETSTRSLALECERFVPGHGPMGTPADLVEARDLIAELVASGTAALEGSADASRATSEVREALRERFGGWLNFDRMGEAVDKLHAELRAG